MSTPFSLVFLLGFAWCVHAFSVVYQVRSYYFVSLLSLGGVFVKGGSRLEYLAFFVVFFLSLPPFPSPIRFWKVPRCGLVRGRGVEGGSGPLSRPVLPPRGVRWSSWFTLFPQGGRGWGSFFCGRHFPFVWRGDRSSCSRPSLPAFSPPSLLLPGDGRGGRGRTFFPLYCVFLCLHMCTVFSSLLCVFLFTYVYSVPPASGHAFLHMCIGTACVFTSRGTFGNVGLALRPRLLPRAR